MSVEYFLLPTRQKKQNKINKAVKISLFFCSLFPVLVPQTHPNLSLPCFHLMPVETSHRSSRSQESEGLNSTRLRIRQWKKEINPVRHCKLVSLVAAMSVEILTL